MAQVVNHQLQRPGFMPGSALVRFQADKVALGRVLYEFFGFLANVVPPWLCILMYHLGDE
jgi:hypothetical protein